MSRAICSSCGLRSQRCQCGREASTAGNANGDDVERAPKLTRASFWIIYLVGASLPLTVYLPCFLPGILSPVQKTCHLEVFVDSFSVSNASTANADWNVSFVAKSPRNGCKVSLHMIKTRLLRGSNLISESFTPDYFGKLVNGKINEPLPGFRHSGQGFLIVDCGGIPVNFTVDTAGDVKGSLLGHMRPCEYLLRSNYTDTTF
ncbi:unnamed protein product [Brassica rapa]|uniref:Uncharacterized protein n=1 Tax=Brassica campestris TaxID=3711 RepID=A0A3P6CIL3_BRACM|nr:unnamed protein product [Brassica rapa]VDD18537.1 unnamed protein product [Brassica rapa]